VLVRRLAAEDRGPNEVLAVIRAPKAASDAYIAMVEENEIRVGLSYYERARIVVKSVEAGVFEDREAALRALFGAVSRAKRSKIRSFTEIVSALDGALSFPTRLAERGGLELARRLSDDPDLAARLRADLAAAPPESAEAELARLSGPRRAARPATPDPETAPPDTAVPPAPADPPRVVTAYNPERGEITLSGPGVTAALRAALDRWLADRG